MRRRPILIIGATIFILVGLTASSRRIAESPYRKREAPTGATTRVYSVTYNPESQTYTYTDHELGFSFQFPKTAMSVELEDSTDEYSNTSSQQFLRILGFCTPLHCLANSLFVEKYSRGALTDLNYSYLYAPDSQLAIKQTKFENIIINGHEAIRVTVEYEGVDEPTQFVHMLGNGYLFTWRTVPDVLQDAPELTEAFFSSFKLL